MIKSIIGKKKKEFIIFIFFILVTFIFWFVRLWRFEELMTFYSDQALFMNDVWQMVQSKRVRLIGPMVLSKVVEGRGFFTGPLMYYALTPLALITNWDVVLMTKIFMFLWWIAGIGLFFWTGRKLSWLAGISTYAVYGVFPYFLNYNRFIWNPSFLPLLGVLLFWVMGKVYTRSNRWLWLLMGIVIGMGISLHYGAVMWGLIASGLWLWGYFKKYWNSKAIILLIFGILIGDLPLIIFEIRHGFYNFVTILLFLRNMDITIRGGIANLYHLSVLFLPIIFFLWGWSIFKLQQRSSTQAITLTICVFFVCFASIDWQKRWGMGMPEGWNVFKQKSVARMICNDIGNQPFEVAATINGDTRATALRWWLVREGCQPMRVEDYPAATTLYLVSTSMRKPENENVWEVKSLRPFAIEKSQDLSDGIIFYKLRRLPKNP